jgi:hypothetical protein
MELRGHRMEPWGATAQRKQRWHTDGRWDSRVCRFELCVAVDIHQRLCRRRGEGRASQIGHFRANLMQKMQKMQKTWLFLPTWRLPSVQKALQYQANLSLWYGCYGTVRTDASVWYRCDTQNGRFGAVPFVRTLQPLWWLRTLATYEADKKPQNNIWEPDPPLQSKVERSMERRKERSPCENISTPTKPFGHKAT